MPSFLGANGARSGVQSFVATPQAGVSDLTVAAAVARQLIEHDPYFGRLLVGMDLPRIAEILTFQLSAGQNRRKRAHFNRGGRGCPHVECAANLGMTFNPPLKLPQGSNLTGMMAWQ